MEGLEKFCEAFAEFTNNYVVIGGTACDIAMTGTVVRPRATDYYGLGMGMNDTLG